MANLPPANLSGLWTFNGQTVRLDYALAERKGYKVADSIKTLHGTYTRPCLFRVVAKVNGPVANAVLDIFDENGYFAHFVWDDTERWIFRNEPVTFTGDDSPSGKKIKPLTLFPTLSLTEFREDNFPHNGARRTLPCPLPPETGARGGEFYVIEDSSRKVLDLPSQFIKFESARAFEWVQPAHDGKPKLSLSFVKLDPETRKREENMKPWGEVFTGQSIAQVDLPFLGFDAGNLDLYDAGGISNSGTDARTPVGNEGETFSGTPIFDYPSESSYDYARSTLNGNPFVPFGVRAEKYETAIDSTHTEMLSSVSDHMHSWSLTLGLSAGIDKIVSADVEGSLAQKVEEQMKNECRYTVSRKVGTTHRVFLDYQTLKLQRDYKDAILARLGEIIRGETPEWDHFVEQFGTHYAHAITFGHMTLAETRYSLKAEYIANEKKISLTENAEATLENLVKVGGKIGADFAWGSKLGSEVSREDVKVVSVGSEHSPMAIFFDLRPASELMSPIFFRHNPSPDALLEHSRAPFIWFTLRQSFQNYLAGMGLNEPLDQKYSADFTPRFFKLSFSKLSFRTPSPDWPYIYGKASIVGVKGGQLLFKNDINIDYKDAQSLNNDENLHGYETLTAIAAATSKQIDDLAHFEVKFEFKNWHKIGRDDEVGMPTQFYIAYRNASPREEKMGNSNIVMLTYIQKIEEL